MDVPAHPVFPCRPGQTDPGYAGTNVGNGQIICQKQWSTGHAVSLGVCVYRYNGLYEKISLVDSNLKDSTSFIMLALKSSQIKMGGVELLN